MSREWKKLPAKVQSDVFHHFRFYENESWKVYDVFNQGRYIFFTKIKTLFSATYISVVIDLYLEEKKASF